MSCSFGNKSSYSHRFLRVLCEKYLDFLFQQCVKLGSLCDGDGAGCTSCRALRILIFVSLIEREPNAGAIRLVLAKKGIGTPSGWPKFRVPDVSTLDEIPYGVNLLI